MIKATTKVVRGFKGEECTATCHGTLQWTWDDDMGVETVILIPNSYFVPKAVLMLLCLQYWAQEVANHSSPSNLPQYGCDTKNTCITLYWKQRSR